MKLMSRFCVTLVAGGLVALQAAAKIDLKRVTPVPADQPIPIQDYFRPHILLSPTLNPSGTRIACRIAAGEDKHELLVYELASQKSEVLSTYGDRDIYNVQWLGDKRLMFKVGAEKLYGFGLLAGDVGRLKKSYPLLQFFGTSVISVPRGDRLRPLVWNRYDFDTGRDRGAEMIETEDHGGVLLDVLSVNTSHNDFLNSRETSQRRILKSNPIPKPGITYGYMADRDGKLAFAFTSLNGALSFMRLDGNEWVRCPIDLEVQDAISSGDEPGQVVFSVRSDEDKPAALKVINVATGEDSAVLLQDTGYDFDGSVFRHPADGRIVGLIYNRDIPKSVWFDPSFSGLQRELEGMFPGVVVRIIDCNEAQDVFLFATYSDRQPVIYNWVDMKKHTAGLFKSSAPWIDPKRMRPMSMIKFKTRDGRRLDAYLTLPEGASKENPAPLVVLPHGGPWARDYWGFNGEVQFLASLGYAVVQPNYRGSTGYNWMFPFSDQWDFEKMHADVTDATRATISTGYVDPDRIAIMGGSFGGYLAVSGVVNEPELYRCAVTIAGVFDWEEDLKDQKYDRFDSPSYSRYLTFLGDPKKEPEKFDRISPGRHTDRIRVPVFVAGGKDDPVVEITQSKKLISELKSNNVTYESYIVSKEGHGMGYLTHNVELYSRIRVFLAKHMTPRAAR